MAKFDDDRVLLSGEKEEESRRRRVHDPGASALGAPIPTVIESVNIPPPQRPHCAVLYNGRHLPCKHDPSRGCCPTPPQHSHSNNNSTGRPGPPAPLESSALKRDDRNRWMFPPSCSVASGVTVCMLSIERSADLAAQNIFGETFLGSTQLDYSCHGIYHGITVSSVIQIGPSATFKHTARSTNETNRNGSDCPPPLSAFSNAEKFSRACSLS